MLNMIPMLPLCKPFRIMKPFGLGLTGAASPAMPMMPMSPMMNAPLACPMNNVNMLSTSVLNEYDSHMYGRFRHVEKEHPCYRHAPFDWYRPPKQCFNIIHEDAAVVTQDGPVPLGDFYRYYIYGDDGGDYDDYSSSSFSSDDYNDTEDPSYPARSRSRRGHTQRDPSFSGQYNNRSQSSMSPSTQGNNYATLSSNRPPINAASVNRSQYVRGNRTLAGDDDFNDAASVNSTYGR